MTLTEDSSSTIKYDIHKHDRNNPRVRHISDPDLPVSINNSTTVKIMNNVRQRKIIESFLIKNDPIMNVCQCSVNFDHLTSSILLNNVPDHLQLTRHPISFHPCSGGHLHPPLSNNKNREGRGAFICNNNN